MSGPTASVVIPAHNEANVLRRTLTTLLAGARPGELEVVVACNGCTDGTAEVARGFGASVRVLELPEASKTAALNAADAVAGTFPRVYLDADIELPARAVRELPGALADPQVLLAAPSVSFVLDGRPWPVRAYFEIWTRLPWITRALGGGGVYALSARGRGRFYAFPDVLGDDLYVRSLMRPEERRATAAACVVRPPRTLWSLIRTKSRAYRGNAELARRHPAGGGLGLGTTRAAVTSVLHQPKLWPAATVYAAVVLCARALAASRRPGSPAGWARDETARIA